MVLRWTEWEGRKLSLHHSIPERFHNRRETKNILGNCIVIATVQTRKHLKQLGSVCQRL